jgi:hypothetical protein
MRRWLLKNMLNLFTLNTIEKHTKKYTNNFFGLTHKNKSKALGNETIKWD